jgi:hypothetical protein
MKKQTFEQIIHQKIEVNTTDQDYYSDVALKILLRSVTPVTVAPTFENSVLQKIAFLNPSYIYRNSVAGLVLFTTIAISFFSFSTIVNTELSTIRSVQAIENTSKLPLAPKQESVEVKKVPVQVVDVENSENDKNSSLKKKIYKRKSSKNTPQISTPPPPKGIE